MDYRNIRKVLVSLSFSLLCAAHATGLTVNVTSVNQTQAVIQEQGFSGSCTIQLSTSPSMTPLHPDVNGTEYSGANTDTGRSDTITSSDGSTRFVTIGHQNDDRALAAYMTYYYQVSGCGNAVTGSFVTANLSTGTTRTEQTPFNGSKWGNLGLPAFDWTKKQVYVDPMTGATLIPMTTSVQTWRTGCGQGGCISSSRAFTDWAGGTGWTNPGGVLLGASTNAITSGTNPLDLYADLSYDPDPLPYNWHRILEDVGVVVFGGASGTSAADRVIDLCIFLNPAMGCASNTIQVTLPSGSASHVTSGSLDMDGAFPASFPSSPFYGWTQSISPLIHMENRETSGTLTINGNTLTIGSIGTQQHFSSAITAGQRIYIAGSNCPNQMCTIAAVPGSPYTATILENPGSGTAAFRAYGWGIRVWKDNANGAATVGLQFKLAGSNTPVGVQPGGDKCSRVQVTSGDGKQGYLCSLTSVVTGFGWLAFVATDGTTRILSFRTGFSFDDTQGNVFYNGATNSSGGRTVLKYTYTGDYTAELNYNYTCGPGGDCPASPNDQLITSTDLMPHSSNADLDQQIEANQGVTLPPYNASIYGPWTQANGAVGYYGSSGHFAFFCNQYAGQGQPNAGGPGWCAAVDLSQNPAKVVRLIHTLDGTGAPNARFGSLHSPQEVDSNPNTLFLSLDGLDSNSTSILHGGPYQAPVNAILMADGTWNTNTCLDWPPGQGQGACSNPNYDRSCPTNIVGPRRGPSIGGPTECVTLQLPQNGVCNVAASAIEIATWPCPWNNNYSQYPLMQAGDNSADLAVAGGIDSEHFHILSVRPDVNNTLRVVAARNGTYDYCSISPWHGQVDPLSVDGAYQFQHLNGWTLTMMPGSVNSCGSAVLLQEQTSGSVQELGHSFSGHFQIGAGSDGINFVTSANTIYNTPFSSLGQIPEVLNSASTAFHGSGTAGQVQSYTDDSQSGAGASGYPWALDMNALFPCGDYLGCGVTRTLTPVIGNVYKIQSLGSVSASNATYKTQPMIGWAGRYQLRDVSGPSSSVDATPYSMCFAILAGECHPGSSANDVYVNVPAAGADPGYCIPGMTFMNNPCVVFGDNSPAGGMRQFGIYTNDSAGALSRVISDGWSSTGRHTSYAHGTAYPTGQWAMMMPANSMDGFGMTGLMISLPPWVVTPNPDNDFKGLMVQIPSGAQYAEVRFGYSRYIGPNASPGNGLYCTSRAEGCITNTGSLFNFESESSIPITCGSGCVVTIPTVAPNLLYYQVRRSADGFTWTNSDIQAIALQ